MRRRFRTTRRLAATVAVAVIASLLGPLSSAQASHETISITGSTPASPSNNNNPTIQGTTTAAAGTTMGILTASSCTSGLVATATIVAGSPNTFSVPVTVSSNSSTTFYAGVYTGSPAHIACSTGFNYQEDSAQPTAGLPSGPTTPQEGATATYTFTASDANQTGKSGIASTGTSGNCGSGTKVPGSDSFPGTTGSNSASGSFQCTFPDGATTTSVSVTVTDRAGNVRTSSGLSVSINNVGPTVGFVSGPVTAATAHTYVYDYSITDPGDDTVASVQTSCGIGGTKSNESNDDASGSFSCSWSSAGTPTVTARATDSDGVAGNTASLLVVVDPNQAPVVTLDSSNDLSVDEGSSTTFSYSISDTELDGIASVQTSCGSAGVKVGGSDSFDDDSGSFSCSFPDGPDSSTVSASATDALDAVGVVDTQDVTVANVAPTVTLTSAPLTAIAHHPADYAYTVTDPGADTIVSVETSCGLGVKLDDVFALGVGSFTCTWSTPSDGGLTSMSESSSESDLEAMSSSGDSDVTVTATDSDGASDTETQSVTVEANQAPVVSLDSANVSDVDEGPTVHTFSYSISDAEADAIASVETSCGDAGTKVAGSDTFDDVSGSFECTFPDGPDSSTVSAAATDEFDAAGSQDTDEVTISNVAPSVTLSGPDTAHEGTTKTYTYTVTDPGDDSPTITESCGSNGDFIDTPLVPNSFDCSFPDGPKTSDISVAADDGSVSESDTITTSIADIPLTVELTGAATVDEGSTTTYSYTLTDPGNDPVTSITEDCGAGATTIDTPLVPNSFDCSFPDGPASSSVTITAAGKDGSGQDSIDVSVANVAPSVTLTGPSPVDEGNSADYSFTITDPGTDTVTTKTGYPSCGTLGTATVTGVGTFTCTFAPVTATTVSSVAIEVEDDSGVTASATKDVTVNNVPRQGGGSGGGGGSGSGGGSGDGSDPDPSFSGAPTLQSLETGPASFSPNNDGRKDQFEVTAAFSEPVSWTFEVLASASGSLLGFIGPASAFSNHGEGDVVEATWDGSMGDLSVPEGDYTWTLTAKAETGAAVAPITGSVTVDNTAPVFTKFRVRPKLFRRSRGVRIRLAANESAVAKIVVLRRGRTVRRFGPTSLEAKRTFNALWDGRNASGRHVARGRYQMVVKVVDDAGNRSVKRLTVRVKH